jgi:hypothetical protein
MIMDKALTNMESQWESVGGDTGKRRIEHRSSYSRASLT